MQISRVHGTMYSVRSDMSQQTPFFFGYLLLFRCVGLSARTPSDKKNGVEHDWQTRLKKGRGTAHATVTGPQSSLMRSLSDLSRATVAGLQEQK